MDPATVRRLFNVAVERILLELRRTSSLDMSDVDDALAAKQRILVWRSFGSAITKPAGIAEAVSEFVSRAAENLRQQDCAIGAVGVLFTTSRFRQNDRQNNVNVMVPLVRPTADAGLLVDSAVGAALREFRPGF